VAAAPPPPNEGPLRVTARHTLPDPGRDAPPGVWPAMSGMSCSPGALLADDV
jgi:hypothetical protein